MGANGPSQLCPGIPSRCSALQQGSPKYVSQTRNISLTWNFLKMQTIRPYPSTIFERVQWILMHAKVEKHCPTATLALSSSHKRHSVRNPKAIAHHLLDDVKLTSSNDLWGRITIWDSYDLTLTNSGDSGTLGCSTALGGKKVK